MEDNLRYGQQSLDFGEIRAPELPEELDARSKETKPARKSFFGNRINAAPDRCGSLCGP
jgi:hypothetical protein